MRLPKICIERPVFALVLNIILIVIGIIAYKKLPISYFPQVPNNRAVINVTYYGASADLMESQVTDVIENQVASIDNVESYSSSSWYQRSQVIVNFKLTKNLEKDIFNLRYYFYFY